MFYQQGLQTRPNGLVAIITRLVAQHAGADPNRATGFAFSVFRPLRRWASDTLMPPNFAFQS